MSLVVPSRVLRAILLVVVLIEVSCTVPVNFGLVLVTNAVGGGASVDGLQRWDGGDVSSDDAA